MIVKSICEVVFYCICWLKFCNLYPEMFRQRMFFKIAQNSQEPLFNKVAVLRASSWKKTPTQVRSREICEIFDYSFFEEHLWTTASKPYLKGDSNVRVLLYEFCELFKNTFFNEHLWMAGSKRAVQGFLLNKVASLTAWRPLTVLERDSSTVIFLWILYNF